MESTIKRASKEWAKSGIWGWWIQKENEISVWNGICALLPDGNKQCRWWTGVVNETTVSLNPLKGLNLGCLLDESREGERESLGLKSFIQGRKSYGETPRELDWSSLVVTLAFIYYS